MRVLRGRRERPTADRAATADLLERAADGTAGVRVWAPTQQVAFGRRDTRESGYSAAKRIAEESGFTPIERDVGGRAVAYTGETLAFAVAVPRTDDAGSIGIDERYTWATRTVRSVLSDLGAETEAGEPPESFCPGDHSIRVVDGGKLSGIAQRVRADVALVAGCVVITRADASALASVVDPVYDALGVPFDPNSVGSVATAGGPDDHRTVARAVESGLVRAIDGDGMVGDPTQGEPTQGEPTQGEPTQDEPTQGETREIVRVGPEPW